MVRLFVLKRTGDFFFLFNLDSFTILFNFFVIFITTFASSSLFIFILAVLTLYFCIILTFLFIEYTFLLFHYNLHHLTI